MSTEHIAGLKVAVIGHSFVKRLQSAVTPRVGTRHQRDRSTAKNMGVDNLYSGVEIRGKSGAKARDLVGLVDHVCTKAGIDAFVIDMGSNDLCQSSCDVEMLADSIFSVANYAHHGHGVRVVILCCVLNRGRCREVSPDIFAQRKAIFNDLMRGKVQSEKGLHFFMFSGFWHDHQGDPLPVAAWSSDLIHPGPNFASVGFKKYLKNIRACLLMAAAKLHQE